MHKNHRVKNSEHNHNVMNALVFFKIYYFKCPQNMQIKNKAKLQERFLTNRV